MSRISTGLLRAVLVALLVLCSTGATATDEYQLKAAYLVNFAKLVQWPEARAPGVDEPVVIGVHARAEVVNTLQKAVEAAVANGHPVRIRTVSRPSDASGIHILFVDAEHVGSLDLVAAARTASVLTVGESDGFATRGGTINFYTESNKLRFEINNDVAQQSGLKISSRLLRLAKPVREEP